MGFFTLFASLVSTINDTIKESNKKQRETKVYNSYEDLDFANINTVTILSQEMTYRTETEEEFDPVMTNFLTDMDGWQHYETKTVEYEVENGYEYTFLIHYTNGKSITRTYHESHPNAQSLLNFQKRYEPCECPDTQEISIQVEDVIANLDNVIDALKDLSDCLRPEPDSDDTSNIQLQPEPQIKENFVVIDFETTGTNYNSNSPEMDEILSVSIINQDGEVLLHTLCNTERKKSWYGAQRVHGISPQDVQGYPTFSQILPKVLEILSSARFVIAYNIIFEKNFVESYIKRTNPMDLVNYRINWAMDKDPMHMYANYIGSRRWVKLEDAARSYGYNFNAHDSLEDVKATLFLYNQLK